MQKLTTRVSGIICASLDSKLKFFCADSASPLPQRELEIRAAASGIADPASMKFRESTYAQLVHQKQQIEENVGRSRQIAYNDEGTEGELVV